MGQVNMISTFSGHDLEDQENLYSLADYKFGLITIPNSMVLAMIVIIFMRESHPERSIVKEYGAIPDATA